MILERLRYISSRSFPMNGKEATDNTVTIVQTTGGNSTNYDNPIDAANGNGTGSTVEFNETKTTGGVDVHGSGNRPTEIGLGHELIHAGHGNNGTRDTTPEPSKTDPDAGTRGRLTKEETQTRKEENILRKEHKLPARATPL